jgi:hypothetical protein
VHTGFWWGNLRERDHLKDPGLDGRIILKWISRTWDGRAWTELSSSQQGQMTGTCECGNELSGSIKCRVFLD